MMLFMDGFGSYGGSSGLMSSEKWTMSGGSLVATIGSGRVTGSSALYLDGSGDYGTAMNRVLPTDYQTLFLGYAFNDRSSGNIGGSVWLLDSMAAAQLILYRGPFNLLTVKRADGTILLTASTPMFMNRWHYVEIGCCISLTAGWVELRLDSNLVGTYYGTGTTRATANGNTRSSTLSSARMLALGAYSSPGGTPAHFTFTDLVIMNDTIADPNMPNNDFIGDVRVPWIMPTGPGAHTDFAIGGTTPAATNWQAVDQQPAPGDVSYVSSSTVGAIDTYQMGDLPASTQKVFAIRPQIIVRKDDAGARAAVPLVRWATGPLDIPLGTGTALQTSYGMLDGILEVRPDGQPWTAADVDALEMGVKLSS